MSDKIKKAISHLSEICKKPNTFKMSIPVQDSDSDIILMGGYTEGMAAIQEIDQLKSKLAAVTKIADEMIDAIKREKGNDYGTPESQAVLWAIADEASGKLKELNEIVGER